MYQALDDYIGKFKPSLVILDVLSDLFAGDENNRPQAREFIGLLKRLARKHACAILLLAHPSVSGMTSGAGTSGSTAWNNSARGRMYLSRVLVEGAESDKNLRKFEVKKANYEPASLSVTVEWSAGVFVLASGHVSLNKSPSKAKPNASSSTCSRNSSDRAVMSRPTAAQLTLPRNSQNILTQTEFRSQPSRQR
jgi:RecA-family ATPase